MPPPVCKASFSNHVKKIKEASDKAAEADMSQAASELRQLMMEEDPSISEDSPIEVCVSYHGTWSKRGFSTNHGIGIVISMDTSKVLDKLELCKICNSCSKHAQDDHSTQEYKDWYAKHKASGTCQKNYDGSSPSMETHIAGVLWRCSISKHNLIYKRMVCDGDSKSYNEVRNTYGDNNLVEKVDCIGHVGKRMFRALENIKKSHTGRLSDGKFIGGGGGRLTSGPNGVITCMSQLYRNTKKVTISDEELVKSGVTKMQNAILAVLYHSIKLSDDAVRHQYCQESTPDTPSWCEFKRDGNMDNKHHHLDPVFLDLLNRNLKDCQPLNFSNAA